MHIVAFMKEHILSSVKETLSDYLNIYNIFFQKAFCELYSHSCVDLGVPFLNDFIQP